MWRHSREEPSEPAQDPKEGREDRLCFPSLCLRFPDWELRITPLSCSGVDSTPPAVSCSLQRKSGLTDTALLSTSDCCWRGRAGLQGLTDLEGRDPGTRGLSFPLPGFPALWCLPGPSELFDGIRANLLQMC